MYQPGQGVTLHHVSQLQTYQYATNERVRARNQLPSLRIAVQPNKESLGRWFPRTRPQKFGFKAYSWILTLSSFTSHLNITTMSLGVGEWMLRKPTPEASARSPFFSDLWPCIRRQRRGLDCLGSGNAERQAQRMRYRVRGYVCHLRFILACITV
jgi:hypothetical protein